MEELRATTSRNESPDSQTFSEETLSFRNLARAYALRFAGITRIREDKSASEIETIDRVIDRYEAQIERKPDHDECLTKYR